MQDLFIIAGTGARALQLASTGVKKKAYDYLHQQLSASKEKHGDNLRVMSGIAEGFDALLAKVAIDLDIKLILAIPNKGYGNYYWGKYSQTTKNRMEFFNWYLSKADEIVYVMEDVHNCKDLYLVNEEGRKVHSNFIRNEYMVERADAFFVYAPQSSGTKHCLTAIQKANKPYKIVDVS